MAHNKNACSRAAARKYHATRCGGEAVFSNLHDLSGRQAQSRAARARRRVQKCFERHRYREKCFAARPSWRHEAAAISARNVNYNVNNLSAANSGGDAFLQISWPVRAGRNARGVRQWRSRCYLISAPSSRGSMSRLINIKL